MSAFDSPITEAGARSYAFRLASYITDASTIHAACRRQYSGGIPTRETIAGWIAENKAQRELDRNRYGDPDLPSWPAQYVPPVKSLKLVPEPVVEEKPAKPQGSTLFPAELVARVAAGFGLTHADIVGEQRFGLIIDARATAAVLLRERGLSYPNVGKHLGGRDHSSIVNAVRKFPRYQERNRMVAVVYAANRLPIGAAA